MGFLGKISVASAILLVVGAQAQAKTPSLKDALQNCARVPDAAQRLACFEDLAQKDAAKQSPPPPGPAAAGGAAETASKPPVTASEQRAAAREMDRRRTAYAATVARSWSFSTGDYYIALANGEIWKSEARDKVLLKDGEAVELSPGAVGSWFMKFKSATRPAIRVSLVK